MKLTRFVQSTIVLEAAGRRVLVDPGKYNPARGVDAERVGRLDGIIITHKHADHFDLEFLRTLMGDPSLGILTNEEIGGILRLEGIGCTIGRIGETHSLAGIDFHLTKTDHVVRDEVIVNFGLVAEADGARVFHTSDTRYIDPPKLNCPKALEADVALVPISNRGVVMGIDDALYFLNGIRPRIAIPVHYHSPKDEPRVKPQAFLRRAKELTAILTDLQSIDLHVMEIGETYDIG